MSFSSNETVKLQMVRKQLKEWCDNIPDCIKYIQQNRQEIENDMINRGEDRWRGKTN